MKIDYKIPQCQAADLAEILPNACSEAIDLIKQMTRPNPENRPTASALLSHPFFHDIKKDAY